MATVLTDEDYAAIHVWVGSEWSESDMDDRFDRLQDVDEVVLEILNQQIADLSASPSSVSFPGLSISNGQNMLSLQETLKRFRAQGGGTSSLVQFRPIFRPDYNRQWCR
jgi:TolA-binding protein